MVGEGEAGAGVEEETAALLAGAAEADLGSVLAQLVTRSAHLDKELRKQISSHHEKLLTQVPLRTSPE